MRYLCNFRQLWFETPEILKFDITPPIVVVVVVPSWLENIVGKEHYIIAKDQLVASFFVLG